MTTNVPLCVIAETQIELNRAVKAQMDHFNPGVEIWVMSKPSEKIVVNAPENFNLNAAASSIIEIMGVTNITIHDQVQATAHYCAKVIARGESRISIFDLVKVEAYDKTQVDVYAIDGETKTNRDVALHDDSRASTYTLRK